MPAAIRRHFPACVSAPKRAARLLRERRAAPVGVGSQAVITFWSEESALISMRRGLAFSATGIRRLSTPST